MLRSPATSRYLMLTPGFDGADGIATVSRLTLRALLASEAGRDARFDIVSLADDRGTIRVPPHPRIRIHCARGRRTAFVATALRLGATLRPATHILCMHAHLGPLALVLARGRARLVTFLYGVEAWRRLRGLESLALRRSDLLLAISEHTERRFHRANPQLADRPLRVCHLCLREELNDAAAALPRSPGDGDPSAFALIVGRMMADERYKGHDLLIDIWPRVMEEAPGSRLVIAGDGDDRPRLEALAASAGDRIQFVGRVSDRTLADLYRDCAFFLMPSRDEGFGLVFLEAMRAGKACIGGEGAAAEIIDDGVTGIVVDPGDAEQVLKAVLRLFREPATRMRMGHAGAARVRERFTEAHFQRRFLEHLRSAGGAA